MKRQGTKFALTTGRWNHGRKGPLDHYGHLSFQGKLLREAVAAALQLGQSPDNFVWECLWRSTARDAHPLRLDLLP